MSQSLLEMAKDLILAQIHAQKLSPEDMHTALQHTYGSLLALQAQDSLPYTFLLLNGHMESYWDPETFIEKVIEKTKAELEQA